MEINNKISVKEFFDYDAMIDSLKLVKMGDGSLRSCYAQYGDLFKVGERYYVYSDKGLTTIKHESEIQEENMKKELMSLLSYQVDKKYKVYNRMDEKEKEKYGNYVDDIIKVIRRYGIIKF